MAKYLKVANILRKFLNDGIVQSKHAEPGPMETVRMPIVTNVFFMRAVEKEYWTFCQGSRQYTTNAIIEFLCKTKVVYGHDLVISFSLHCIEHSQ